MATANAWLQKQRKGDLSDIAEHVGLKGYERFKKSELEILVEQYLRDNQTSLQKDPKVSPFYAGVAPASPVKHNLGPAEQATKPRRRQTIKAREELDDDSSPISKPFTALTKRTPARALSMASRVPLPPSPAVLANKIDAQTSSMRTSISDYISTSRLPGTLDTVRANLSTVTSIELLTLFVEVAGLRREVLPLRYLTTLPAIPAIGTNELSIKIPDLFALLTTAFWGPVGLWLITSVALPLIGAYFINLKGEGYDAVSFNATKALIAWIVYVRNGVRGESKAVVEKGVPGGSTGMFIGAGVGGLAALYDAVLKR